MCLFHPCCLVLGPFQLLISLEIPGLFLLVKLISVGKEYLITLISPSVGTFVKELFLHIRSIEYSYLTLGEIRGIED